MTCGAIRGFAKASGICSARLPGSLAGRLGVSHPDRTGPKAPEVHEGLFKEKKPRANSILWRQGHLCQHDGPEGASTPPSDVEIQLAVRGGTQSFSAFFPRGTSQGQTSVTSFDTIDSSCGFMT